VHVAHVFLIPDNHAENRPKPGRKQENKKNMKLVLAASNCRWLLPFTIARNT
jgi:hypothetical protein